MTVTDKDVREVLALQAENYADWKVKVDSYSTYPMKYEKDIVAFRKEQVELYLSRSSFERGKKYVKLLAFDSTTGFIATETVLNKNKDVMFSVGDLLKAASYSAPARNYARGNIATLPETLNWSAIM
jgi:hypothetical protein